MPACAIVDVREDIHYSYQGGQIAKPIFSQIVPGVTTREWLNDNLGEPVADMVKDGGEVELIYQYEEFVNTKARVLFLFYRRSAKIIPRQLVLELKDNIVSRIGPGYFADKE